MSIFDDLFADPYQVNTDNSLARNSAQAADYGTGVGQIQSQNTQQQLQDMMNQSFAGNTGAQQAQTGLIGQLQAQANGTGGPNLGALQLQQGLDSNIAASQAQAQSARGINPAQAERMAMQGQQAAVGQAGNQAAQIRANQELGAQQQLGQLSTEQQQQNLAQQQVGVQNQTAENQTAEQNAALRAQIEGQNAQLKASAQGLNAAQQQAGQAAAGPLLGAVAGSGGQLLSTLGSVAAAAAHGGQIERLRDEGGGVPGHPRMPKTDTPVNDTVPTILTPKEVVLPLSVTQSDNPPEAAKHFMMKEMMKHHMRQQGVQHFDGDIGSTVMPGGVPSFADSSIVPAGTGDPMTAPNPMDALASEPKGAAPDMGAMGKNGPITTEAQKSSDAAMNQSLPSNPDDGFSMGADAKNTAPVGSLGSRISNGFATAGRMFSGIGDQFHGTASTAGAPTSSATQPGLGTALSSIGNSLKKSGPPKIGALPVAPNPAADMLRNQFGNNGITTPNAAMADGGRVESDAEAAHTRSMGRYIDAATVPNPDRKQQNQTERAAKEQEMLFAHARGGEPLKPFAKGGKVSAKPMTTMHPSVAAKMVRDHIASEFMRSGVPGEAIHERLLKQVQRSRR